MGEALISRRGNPISVFSALDGNFHGVDNYVDTSIENYSPDKKYLISTSVSHELSTNRFLSSWKCENGVIEHLATIYYEQISSNTVRDEFTTYYNSLRSGTVTISVKENGRATFTFEHRSGDDWGIIVVEVE